LQILKCLQTDKHQLKKTLTDLGVALFVSICFPSILCGLFACTSVTHEDCPKVTNPNPLDLLEKEEHVRKCLLNVKLTTFLQ